MQSVDTTAFSLTCAPAFKTGRRQSYCSAEVLHALKVVQQREHFFWTGKSKPKRAEGD
jgi:hypothetical protein